MCPMPMQYVFLDLSDEKTESEVLQFHICYCILINKVLHSSESHVTTLYRMTGNTCIDSRE